jgi:hypothetical protein
MVGVSGEGFLNDNEFYRENEGYQGSYPAKGCGFVLTGVHSFGVIPDDVWARAARLWQQEEQKLNDAKAALGKPTESSSDSSTDIPPDIKQELKAKTLAPPAPIDLNADGVPEEFTINRTGCGSYGCEWSLLDGKTHKAIFVFFQVASVHLLETRTNGYPDLLEDAGTELYIQKYNGDKYDATACYSWLARDGSDVSRADAWAERTKLKEISCKTY